MAVAGRGRDEMCLNHPDRPAVGRCGACHKPICAECTVSTGEGRFCSHTCAQRTADFRARGGAVKKSRSSVAGLVKAVVWVVVVIIALGVVNRYVMRNNMPVIGKYLNRLPVLGVSSAQQQPPAQ